LIIVYNLHYWGNLSGLKGGFWRTITFAVDKLWNTPLVGTRLEACSYERRVPTVLFKVSDGSNRLDTV